LGIIRVPTNTGARSDGLAVWQSVTLNAVDNVILAIADLYPKRSEIYVTSGTDSDHGATSYHYGKLTYNGEPTGAVDFGAYTGTTIAEGDRRMRDFAKWLEDNFVTDIVELIHSTPYSTDDGFYVKNGRSVPQGYYGATTEAAHRNHVHLAMSLGGANRALAKLSPAAPAPVPGSPFPLPAGHYYGLITGPAESHGGYYASEQPAVKAIQQALIVAGCVPGITNPASGWADGKFEQPTADAVKRYQSAHGLAVDGRVGPITWAALFSTTPAPTPPPPPAPVPGYDGTASPIFAWDASDYDYNRGARPSHVAAAAIEGVRIFTHKATEHATNGVFRHVHMGEMLAAARDAGIPFLAPYVVVRSGVPVATQAATAIAFVREQAPWWFAFPGRFWQVDQEKWPYDNVAADLGEALAVELERQTGTPALLYASHGQYGNSLPGTRPLWNANYNYSGASRPFKVQWADVERSPSTGFAPYSGRTPILLQYASDAVIGGTAPSDASVFRGTAAQFAALIGAATPAPPPDPEPTPDPEPEPTPDPEPEPTPDPEPEPIPAPDLDALAASIVDAARPAILAAVRAALDAHV
jgi:hypothetical protein